MNKILIITDSANNNWDKIFHNHNNDDQYFIYTVNRSIESVHQVIQKHPLYKNYNIIDLDTFEISQLAEAEARDYYLKLIRDLPNRKIFNGRSITDLLTLNDRNYWWYLPISEKNIWLDKSIHRFFEIKRLQYILNNNEYGDMIKMGKLDPAKVTRAALQAAGSVAGLMVTTEAMISDIPEENAGMPAGMPPGMDGMGGMGGMM